MATLDWDCDTENGVTLVRLVARSEARATVRIESQLDGPVWPPRTRGVPEAGWDERGYEGVVEPDDRLVLGYASPAAPTTPPATITEERAPDPEASELTPEALLRTLGEAAPPRDAVSAGESAARRSASTNGTEDDGSPRTDGPAAQFDRWFGDVERRLATAERLADADSVPGARSAVDAAGGIEGVRSLCSRLEADREALAEIEQRARRLRERDGAVEVPVEALGRLV
jgi:hypothetical protein